MTQWAFITNVVYFSIALLSDVTKLRFFTSVKSFIAICLYFPQSMVVMILYHGIQAIDKNAISNKLWLESIPWYHDHIMHTAVGILAVIEIIFVKHRPQPKLTRQIAILIFAVAYIGNCLNLHFKYGVFPYPFLATLWKSAFHWQYVLFSFGTYCFYYYLSSLGAYLNRVSKFKFQ